MSTTVNRMLLPQIQNVHYEETDERLKIVMPVSRNMLFLVIYSVLMLVWLGATVWMLSLLFATSIRELTTSFLVVWILILLVWTYIWLRLGRSVWRWWQYYAATREILFIDDEVLIVRRPLSLLGVTDAYDMQHVSPFYYNEEQQAIAFDYGSRGALVGHSLPPASARRLASALNRRFFPHALLDEEE